MPDLSTEISSNPLKHLLANLFYSADWHHAKKTKKIFDATVVGLYTKRTAIVRLIRTQIHTLSLHPQPRRQGLRRSEEPNGSFALGLQDRTMRKTACSKEFIICKHLLNAGITLR